MLMFRTIFSTCLVLFLTVTCWAAPAAAQQVVRVALEQNPPLAGFDDQGKAGGVFVDILNAIAEKNGLTMEYLSCPQAECLAMLDSHQADFMAPLGWSAERTTRFKFSRDEIITNWGVVYSREGLHINSFLDLQGKKVGGVPNDIHFLRLPEQLKNFGVTVSYQSYPTFDHVFEALEKGEIDAGVVGRFFAYKRASAYNIDVTPIIFNPIHVHLAIAPATDPGLIELINSGIDTLKADTSSVYYSSLKKHLHTDQGLSLPAWVKMLLYIIPAVFVAVLMHILRLRTIVREKTSDLARQFHLYRGVFDSTSHLQGVLSPDGTLLYANKASLEFAGMTEDQVIGKPFWETPWWCHDPQGRQKLREMIQQCAAGEIFRMETEHINAEGEIRIIDFSLTPLWCDDGSLLYLIPVGRDITLRRKHEEELNQQNIFLTTLFESVPFGLWVRDQDGRLVMQNRINQHEYGNQIGSTIEAGSCPDNLKLVWATWLDQVFTEGTPLDMEIREDERIIRKIMVPVYGAPGTKWCFGMNIDITERYRMMQQLREGERRFKSLFDELPFIVTIKNPSTMEYLDVNRFFCEFNQTAKELVIGKKPTEIGQFIDADQHAQVAALLARDGKVDLFEITIHQPDGTPKQGLLSCRIVSLAGSPCNLTVIKDISSLKEAEAALLASREREQSLLVQHEKMLMIGGLAAGMAHELNNPSGIIAHELQNLKRRLSPDLPANRAVAEEVGLDLKQLEAYLELRGIPGFVSSIQQANLRISQIINSMLNFSRQDSHLQQMADINQIVLHAVALAQSDYELRKLYDLKGVMITTDLAESLPPFSGIITEIEQVLINLIKNGAQAMHQQEHDRRISITTSEFNDWIKVSVEDSGPGIPEPLLKRVFEPFFTTKEVGKGTGLGLSVSYAIIVNHHHGRLEVFSPPGCGACFVIWLPAAHEVSE